LFGLYWGVFLAGIAMSLKGTVPAWIGVSLPNIVFFLTGVVIFVFTAER
jgi:lipopolysaccharide export LptBFGC system permease protein LptF